VRESDVRQFELFDDVNVPDRWHLSSVHAPDGTEPNQRGGRRSGVASLRTTISDPGVELDYCWTSVLPVIECLDERRSEFSQWTANDHRPDKVGQYRMVTRLRIVTASLAPDAHILRIAGLQIALVVSETIKSAMERSGCVGAKFVEVT
jgi:hypothetical protein